MSFANAKYTAVLINLLDDPNAKEKITEALSKYPMYEPENNEHGLIPTREQLNQKIIDAYKYREIAFETVGRFIDELRITMCEIMPYYNQMLHTVDIMNKIEDPFGNVDFTETYEEEKTDTSKATSKNSSTNDTQTTDKQQTNTSMKDDSKIIKSDTPQNDLDLPSKIGDVSYASEAQWNENNSNSNGNTNGEGTAHSKTDSTGDNEVIATGKVKHTFSKKGNQGVNTYAHDIIEFRNSILNVEQMIINDKRLKELFLMVW